MSTPRSTQPPNWTDMPVMNRNRRMKRPKLVLGLIVASLFVTAIVVSVVNNSGPDHSAGLAMTDCENQVTDQLKAPSTAHFHGVLADGGDPEYTVAGQVDSENGFGATLTSSFKCTVDFNDPSSSTAEVTLDSLG